MDSRCSDEVYVFATEKLLKKVQYALEDAKRDLEKYVNVSSIIEQLPPPRLPPPPPITPPISDGIDGAMLHDDDGIKVLRMRIKLDRKIEEVYLRHKQQEFDVRRMIEVSEYLWGTFYLRSLTSYSAADIISTLKRFSNRVNKATESYYKKLDASEQFQKQYVYVPSCTKLWP
ncbi:hypothetical protein ACP275_12G133200 [Erythranthe tilingii]